jgi:hypothetical protein
VGAGHRAEPRCSDARDAGVDPEEIRRSARPDDQLSLAEAARLVGVTNQYLRGVARYHDEHRDEIERSLAAGVTRAGRSSSPTAAPRAGGW